MTNRIFDRFKDLSKKKKIQLVAAVSLTVLLVALPVYAWFTHERSIALTTKINAPTQLYITAGNKESAANIDMADIDVESGAAYKDFVFGVGGKDVTNYQLQLAHTTNIPFDYEIYRAKSVDTKTDTSVVYVSKDSGNTFYYDIDSSSSTKIDGKYLNQDDSQILANGDQHQATYGNYNEVQKNAEPLYWQSTTLDVKDSDRSSGTFCDYFILRVKWTPNTVTNNKETDMVYLTVRRTN